MAVAPTPQPAAATPQPQGRGPEDVQSAGVYLKRAFQHFRHAQNGAASRAFRAAIGTGNLNDAGRALAYWHIFVAERNLGDLDISNEALASFVVVAEDVLDVRRHRRYAEDSAGDFVDRFDLARRLARGRAILSAAWADRRTSFGRSATDPVPVHSSREIRFFLDLAPPCGDARDRRVTRGGDATSPLADVHRVTVTCDNEIQRADYYFELVGAHPPQ